MTAQEASLQLAWALSPILPARVKRTGCQVLRELEAIKRWVISVLSFKKVTGHRHDGTVHTWIPSKPSLMSARRRTLPTI